MIYDLLEAYLAEDLGNLQFLDPDFANQLQHDSKYARTKKRGKDGEFTSRQTHALDPRLGRDSEVETDRVPKPKEVLKKFSENGDILAVVICFNDEQVLLIRKMHKSEYDNKANTKGYKYTAKPEVANGMELNTGYKGKYTATAVAVSHTTSTSEVSRLLAWCWTRARDSRKNIRAMYIHADKRRADTHTSREKARDEWTARDKRARATYLPGVIPHERARETPVYKAEIDPRSGKPEIRFDHDAGLGNGRRSSSDSYANRLRQALRGRLEDYKRKMAAAELTHESPEAAFKHLQQNGFPEKVAIGKSIYEKGNSYFDVDEILGFKKPWNVRDLRNYIDYELHKDNNYHRERSKVYDELTTAGLKDDELRAEMQKRFPPDRIRIHFARAGGSIVPTGFTTSDSSW